MYAHPDRGTKFTFAIGARSKAKLSSLVSELSLDGSVQVVEVDVTKPEQVEAAVKKAKVVINTVGPYIRWGTPVVASVFLLVTRTGLADVFYQVLVHGMVFTMLT